MASPSQHAPIRRNAPIVLVVETDETMADTIAAALREAGYAVRGIAHDAGSGGTMARLLHPAAAVIGPGIDRTELPELVEALTPVAAWGAVRIAPFDDVDTGDAAPPATTLARLPGALRDLEAQRRA